MKLPFRRPRLAVIEGCQRVELSNFTTNVSGYWNLVLLETDDVHIHHVLVRNPSGGSGECGGPAHLPGDCFGPNADGIDLVSVRRALVEDNDIISGDDAICIKSGRDSVGRAHGRPAVDIRARNNFIRSASCPHVFRGLGDGCGALKVGTEISGGAANVLFEHNRVGCAGIALKLSAPVPRGGNVSNITWRDITVERSGMLIGIGVNTGADKGHPVPPPADVAAVNGVTFERIVAHNLSCCPGCVDYGCAPKQRSAGWLQAGAWASPSGIGGVNDLLIKNVSVLAAGGAPLSALSWLCTSETLHGTSSNVSPALGSNCFIAKF